MGCRETTDRAIAAIAARQYGVVSRGQLLAAGVSSRQIQRRVATGRLLPLHRAVFAVGHEAPRDEARWLAAVLACGEGAVLSHRSAGALWRVLDHDRALPDVTAATRRRTRGVAVHQGGLVAEDMAVHRRIPVTSPARTLADLAHVLGEHAFERAVRESQFRRLFDVRSVLAVLDRRPSKALRALVADLTPTQTVMEDRLLRLCRRYGLPAPRTQQSIRGSRVDFAWPAHGVIVETDGYEAHGTPAAFQQDRATTNRLQLAGYTILRFTHADLTRRPGDVAGQIRDALAL
jgi:very-short-patch-repair endonuclease